MRDATRRLETSSALSLAQMEGLRKSCDRRDACTAQSRRFPRLAFASALLAASALAQILRVFCSFFHRWAAIGSLGYGWVDSTPRAEALSQMSTAWLSAAPKLAQLRSD